MQLATGKHDTLQCMMFSKLHSMRILTFLVTDGSESVVLAAADYHFGSISVCHT